MIVRLFVDLLEGKISMYFDGVGMGVPPPWRFLLSVVLRLKEIRMILYDVAVALVQYNFTLNERMWCDILLQCHNIIM